MLRIGDNISIVYDWKVNIDDNELEEICYFLEKGELVVFPTETVYGIGANALDEEAVKKIYEAKGRASDNPLIAHISNLEMLRKLVKEIGTIEQKLINAFWPGPLTILLHKNKKKLKLF